MSISNILMRGAAVFSWAALSTLAIAQAPSASTAAGAQVRATGNVQPPIAMMGGNATDPQAIRVLLSPELETMLAAQMLGRISDVKARLGSKVKKGQILLTFDCSEANARQRMAQAEYAAAKESLAVKERLRKLEAAGDTEVALARNEADRAKASIALTQVQTGQCVVRAPFSGHVVKLHVKPHQGVNVGAPLLEMVSDGPLKLRLNVPSRWLHALKVGTDFEVLIDETRQTYPAKVSAINARVDAVAQTVELEAHIEGTPAELLAGMSGVARFSSMQ